MSKQRCDKCIESWRRGYEDAKAIYNEPFMVKALGYGLVVLGTTILLALLWMLK